MKTMRFILILLLLAAPSMLVSLDSCTGKHAPELDTARISALFDSVSYMNMWNATAAACSYDEADSLEKMHGENENTGVIKLATKDIEYYSLTADSLMKEIHNMIKQAYK